MDVDEWLIETEKLELSEDELFKHINFSSCPYKIFNELVKIYNLSSIKDNHEVVKTLVSKLLSKNDLYTEITAYKLKDGTIVESKEDAEIKAKEYKIAKELQEVFEVDKAMFIYDNLELIKKIINQ